MRTASRILALGVWVGTGLGAGLSPVPAAGDERPLYTNVEVVAVDAARRTVVVRNPEGVEERIELDDQVAGFDDIKAGDRVILALRRESGGRRASAIIKSKAPSPAAVSSAPSPEAEGTDRPREISRLDFAAQVAKLAAEADRVDRLWSEFRKACGQTVSGRYDRAREWFALWDGRARADLSMGFCRDLSTRSSERAARSRRRWPGRKTLPDDPCSPTTYARSRGVTRSTGTVGAEPRPSVLNPEEP